ncbi:TPA: hypothetical protein DEP94_02715 [Candidatus Nomurabacteria bacterium]|nr:hypothetical protein [Candidatus Nomurabacteria bacterium]
MIVFIKKIIIFLFPIILLFIFPAMVIFYGREFYSIKEVVATQKEFSQTIFGFSYVSTLFFPYKNLLFREQNGNVIALGTSRVMEIRKEFFIKPNSFVNAGGAVRSLNDAEKFVNDLPNNSNLKVIFFGLDQEMLYEDLNKNSDKKELLFPKRMIDTFSFMSRRMYLDYFSHKFNLNTLINNSKENHNIGISALINGDGFRYDGSYRYFEAQTNKNLIEDVNKRIQEKVGVIKKENNQNYNSKNKILEENLKKLSLFLKLCQEKGILVVGFAPPFPQSVYSQMYEGSGIYKEMVIDNIKKEQDIFRKNNALFFDFSSTLSFGGKDTEFVDEIHGTDKMYARMILFMVENDKELRYYIDEKAIRDLIKNSKNNFLNI